MIINVNSPSAGDRLRLTLMGALHRTSREMLAPQVAISMWRSSGARDAKALSLQKISLIMTLKVAALFGSRFWMVT